MKKKVFIKTLNWMLGYGIIDGQQYSEILSKASPYLKR